MASIKYRLNTKSETAQIYLQLSLGRDKYYQKKTGLLINYKDWSKATGMPLQNKSALKNLSTKLRKLKDFIQDKINDANSTGVEINSNWLEHNINLHFERITENELGDYIEDAIQNIFDTADVRENGKKELGISHSRRKSYVSLNNLLKKYQSHTKKRYKVKDVNIDFATKFLKWLISNERYSKNYALKKLSDLKTVCNDAETYGVETHPQLKKVGKAKGKTELPVYLTPNELKKIKETPLIRESLINARKWLLLGCNIGQRGGDLLQLTSENFVIRNNGLEVIELTQQKTGKAVTIPVLETTKEILDTGLPYKISLQKFNDCIKEICRIAEIDELIEGTKVSLIDKEGNIIPKDENGNYIKKGLKRKIKGKFPKYDLISSHTCRRSFATNNYGTLPTPLIMKITAHSTEKMFLNYVGKDSLDYAQQISDFFELQALKNKKEPKLDIIQKAN